MTKAFLWFLLVGAVFFLVLGMTHMETTKPAVLVFWGVIAAVAAFRLFGPKAAAGK